MTTFLGGAGAGRDLLCRLVLSAEAGGPGDPAARRGRLSPVGAAANRGRHPLIWALALGLTETGSTYFLMDARADAGPILSQRPSPDRPAGRRGEPLCAA